MPSLHFDIAAPRERVWRSMLYSPTYERWTAAFCEGSCYAGSWPQALQALKTICETPI